MLGTFQFSQIAVSAKGGSPDFLAICVRLLLLRPLDDLPLEEIVDRQQTPAALVGVSECRQRGDLFGLGIACSRLWRPSPTRG